MLKRILARFGIYTCSATEREELDALHWTLSILTEPDRSPTMTSVSYNFWKDSVWITIHYGPGSAIIAQGHGPFLKSIQEARIRFDAYIATEKKVAEGVLCLK